MKEWVEVFRIAIFAWLLTLAIACGFMALRNLNTMLSAQNGLLFAVLAIAVKK